MAIARFDPVEVGMEVRAAEIADRLADDIEEIGTEDGRVDDHALGGVPRPARRLVFEQSDLDASAAFGGSIGSFHGNTSTAMLSNTNAWRIGCSSRRGQRTPDRRRRAADIRPVSPGGDWPLHLTRRQVVRSTR